MKALLGVLFFALAAYAAHNQPPPNFVSTPASNEFHDAACDFTKRKEHLGRLYDEIQERLGALEEFKGCIIEDDVVMGAIHRAIEEVKSLHANFKLSALKFQNVPAEAFPPGYKEALDAFCKDVELRVGAINEPAVCMSKVIASKAGMCNNWAVIAPKEYATVHQKCNELRAALALYQDLAANNGQHESIGEFFNLVHYCKETLENGQDVLSARHGPNYRKINEELDKSLHLLHLATGRLVDRVEAVQTTVSANSPPAIFPTCYPDDDVDDVLPWDSS